MSRKKSRDARNNMTYIPIEQLEKPTKGYIPIGSEIPKKETPISLDLGTNIFGTQTSTPAMFPTEYKTIQQVAGEFAKETGQSIVRNIASAGLTIAGAVVPKELKPFVGSLKEDDFKSFLAKGTFETIFGKGEEVKSIEQRIAEAEPKVEEFKKELEAISQTPGLTPTERLVTTILANLDTPSITFLGITGSVGLDLTPFGGLEKNVFKSMIKAKTIGEAIETLTKMGVADDLARQFAGDVVKVADDKTAKKLFEHIANVQQTTKVAPKLAPSISPELEPLAQEAQTLEWAKGTRAAGIQNAGLKNYNQATRFLENAGELPKEIKTEKVTKDFIQNYYEAKKPPVVGDVFVNAKGERIEITKIESSSINYFLKGKNKGIEGKIYTDKGFLSTSKVVDTSNSLAQEAMKYKSAEIGRFAENNAEILYHGTGVKSAESILREGFKTGAELGKGERTNLISLGTKERAIGVGGRGEKATTQLPVPIKGLKLLEVNAGEIYPRNVEKYTKLMNEGGYDGIRVIDDIYEGTGKTSEVLLKKEIATSQLTDFYNQAVKGAKELPSPKAFLEAVPAPTQIGRTKTIIREAIQPSAPKITRGEDVLLRERIRAEARGAKEATQAVRTILRTSKGEAYERAAAELSDLTKKTVQTLKDKTKNIAQKKQIITDYAKTKLSPDLRGRLIVAVNNATTDGDVANAIRRINNLRNEEIKKELVGDIEGAIEKIGALPPNQQKKAAEAIEGLTPETFSKKTQAELAELKEFISKEPEAVFRFGAVTLKKAERAAELGKQPLKETPIRKLIEINDRLEFLLGEGKLTEKTTEELKQLKVDNAIKEITESAPRNLDEGLPPPRKPGEPVPTASFAGARDSTVEAMRKGTQYYVTPDVGFQILDNDKQFGTNWRIFKRPMDTATDLENEMRNDIVDDLFGRLKDIETKHGKLNTENYENVMLWATLRQEGGRAKLQKSDPRLFTDAFLDGVKLTEGETEFYNLGRGVFDELRPDIERVLWNTRGEKLGKVDNYWSWITDFDNSDELFMRLSGDYKLTSRTEQGFTKSRTLAGGQKLNLSALDVLVKHINDSSAFIHKEELINHLSKIAKSEQYAKGVGKMGQKWVAGWLDLLARGGVPKGYKPGPLTQLVRNIGHGVLGFKISPIVKQPLAKIVSVGFLGKDALIHDVQFFTNSGIRDAIHNISKQQKFRNFDDPTYTALAKAKKLAQWQEWGYKGIKTFDSWTADSVWYAAYRKNINDRGIDFSFNLDEFTAGKNIDNEAKEYADLVVRRTQGSSEYKDAPLLYASASNKDLVMAFFQFQRFIHNQSILWRDAKVALAKEKDPIKAAAIASSLVAAGIAEGYITTGMAQIFGSEDYAKKEREEGIGKRVFSAVAGQIPVVSNLVSVAEYGGTGVPVWDVFRQGYQGAISAATAKKTETRIKGGIRAGETALELGGVSGASQVGQILRKFVPEEQKQSPAGKFKSPKSLEIESGKIPAPRGLKY